LSAPFFRLCNAAGLDWKHCFTFLNALVFGWAAFLACRYFRVMGACILIAGMAFSPLLPYMNKAHAEHYAVCLLTVAVLYLQAGRVLAAAVAISLIAAQVTAFSPVAAVLLLWVAWRKWPARAHA